jgi:hypothetical protein
MKALIVDDELRVDSAFGRALRTPIAVLRSLEVGLVETAMPNVDL